MKKSNSKREINLQTILPTDSQKWQFIALKRYTISDSCQALNPLMHSVSALSVHRKNRQADSTRYSQDLERIHNAHWDSRWCSDKLSDICRNYESWQTRFLYSISDNRAHSYRNIQETKYVKKIWFFWDVNLWRLYWICIYFTLKNFCSEVTRGSKTVF